MAMGYYIITDMYLLIKWVEEDEMYDVVSSKSVVPPEGCSSALDIDPGSVVRVAFSGEYYRAEVLEKGMLLYT